MRLRNNHHPARSQSKDRKAKEIKRLRVKERVCDIYMYLILFDRLGLETSASPCHRCFLWSVTLGIKEHVNDIFTFYSTLCSETSASLCHNCFHYSVTFGIKM